MRTVVPERKASRWKFNKHLEYVQIILYNIYNLITVTYGS